MPEWINGWVIGSVVVPLAISVFSKYCPKEKIVGWIKPPCVGLGRWVSRILNVRLGKKNAQKLEEGILVTILHTIGWAALYVEDGMLEDNEIHKPNEEVKK